MHDNDENPENACVNGMWQFGLRKRKSVTVRVQNLNNMKCLRNSFTGNWVIKYLQ